MVRASYDELPAVVDAVAHRLAAADVTVELGPPGQVDLGLLEALARLTLVARRSGTRLVVHAGEEVARLAELTGLSVCLGLPDRLPVSSGQPDRLSVRSGQPDRLAVGSGQPDRHAEPGEQLGTEEVVDVGDPPR